MLANMTQIARQPWSEYTIADYLRALDVLRLQFLTLFFPEFLNCSPLLMIVVRPCILTGPDF